MKDKDKKSSSQSSLNPYLSGNIIIAGGSQIFYYVPCECQNNPYGTIGYCTLCGGAGYRMITEEEYLDMQQSKKKDWKYCPHCGEDL